MNSANHRPDEERRDELISELLGRLPTPGHGDTFWANLDEQLTAESGQAPAEETRPLTSVATDYRGPAHPDQQQTPPAFVIANSHTSVAAGDLPAVGSTRPKHRSRRVLAVLSAAALVLVVSGAALVQRQNDKSSLEVGEAPEVAVGADQRSNLRDGSSATPLPPPSPFDGLGDDATPSEGTVAEAPDNPDTPDDPEAPGATTRIAPESTTTIPPDPPPAGGLAPPDLTQGVEVGLSPDETNRLVAVPDPSTVGCEGVGHSYRLWLVPNVNGAFQAFRAADPSVTFSGVPELINGPQILVALVDGCEEFLGVRTAVMRPEGSLDFVQRVEPVGFDGFVITGAEWDLFAKTLLLEGIKADGAAVMLTVREDTGDVLEEAPIG